MVKLYGIKQCDSVRKARKHLEKRGVAYRFFDFKETPADKDLILQWLQKIDAQTLLNKRSRTYRTLGIDIDMTNQEEIVALLERENLLIKRPVVVIDESVTVGYHPDRFEALLKKIQIQKENHGRF